MLGARTARPGWDRIQVAVCGGAVVERARERECVNTAPCGCIAGLVALTASVLRLGRPLPPPLPPPLRGRWPGNLLSPSPPPLSSRGLLRSQPAHSARGGTWGVRVGGRGIKWGRLIAVVHRLKASTNTSDSGKERPRNWKAGESVASI